MDDDRLVKKPQISDNRLWQIWIIIYLVGLEGYETFCTTEVKLMTGIAEKGTLVEPDIGQEILESLIFDIEPNQSFDGTQPQIAIFIPQHSIDGAVDHSIFLEIVFNFKLGVIGSTFFYNHLIQCNFRTKPYGVFRIFQDG